MAEASPAVVPAVADRCASEAYGAGGDPEVSVVIATHDRAELWGELLGALESQTAGPGRFEVVVVDDCSADGTWGVLTGAAERTSLRLLCLRLAHNVGPGAARTLGLGVCRAPVVAFTDDDCLPARQWLERIAGPLRAGGPSPLVAQGRTEPRPEDAAEAGPWARTLWVLRPSWLFETCNIAYRKADLDAVGGFPSRAETPPSPNGRQVGEDALVGWRVAERGGRLLFVDEALVHHRVTPAGYGDFVREQLGRAVFPALAARHPLARRAFWGRWFLSRRSAGTVLAVVSGVGWLVSGRPAWAVGLLPWAVDALPEACARRGRHPLLRLAQLAVADLVGLGATAWASARWRAVVL